MLSFQKPCSSCNSAFETYVKLHQHCIEEHKMKRCSYCTKFFTVAEYNDHKAGCKDLTPKRFQCTWCPKRFHQSTSKKLHERFLHTGERPHRCTHCPARFHQLSDLRKHEVKHTGFYKFLCYTCKEKRRGSSLKGRCRKHTMLIPELFNLMSRKW